jgi:hypothetical protein
MRSLIDIAIGFLAMGLTEALIKPIAKRFVQRRLLRHAPTLLTYMDQQMPTLLQVYRGQELEQVLRTQLETITGESWAGASLDALFQLYDPRITADRLHSRPQ